MAGRPVTRCEVDGCEARHHARGYCMSHYHSFKAYGDPLALGIPGRRRLPASELSYDGAHRRIKYDRGRAVGNSCVDCGRPAEEWSYDGNAAVELTRAVGVPGPRGGRPYYGAPLRYSADPADYSPRCKACHRRMDDSLIRDRDGLGRFAS